MILTEKFAEKQRYSDIAKAFVIDRASKTLGVPTKDIIIEKTENGKPYFKKYPDFHFNISHTNGAVAVAFSKKSVGVDVEKLRNVNFNIANRFFKKKETEYVFLEPQNTKKRFFEIWTKKEASIKEKGLTLSHISNMDTSHIHTFQNGEFIISVCSECDKSRLIVLENGYDM